MARKLGARKVVRRRKTVSRRKSRIPRGFNPIPDQLMVNLTYNEIFTFGSSTTAFAQIMCGNGIYDPNVTGGGHQPLYRDQYTLLYNKYRVVSSKIYIDCCIPTAGQTCLLTLYPQVTDVTTGSTIAIDIEKPHAKAMLLNGGDTSKKLSHSMSTHKMFGVSSAAVNGDDLFASVYSGNPSNKWYWVLTGQCPDFLSSQGTYCSMRIVYKVVFYDKIRQSQS